MKSTTLLLFSGIASAFYAVILLLAPATFVELHGITTDEVGLLFLRTAGALSVGYMIMGLMGSKLKSEEGIKVLAAANFGGWLVILGVMIYAKCTLPFNSMVFGDIAFCSLFSILFGSKVFGK